MPLQRRNRIQGLAATGLVLCFLLPPHILADAITYQVNVDTSAINSTSGFLDFDFAPAGNNSQAAFVTIGGFSTDGSLVGAPQASGGVSGNLPGTLIINNGTQFNDYFQGFTYGNSLAFLLSFGGPALTSPDGTSGSGSTFAFAMFDSTGVNPLLTTDPNGNTFAVNVNLDGTTTPTNFAVNGLDGAPVASIQQVVPEPSGFVVAALVLACLYGGRRWQRRDKS
jgi:hypothetical protein